MKLLLLLSLLAAPVAAAELPADVCRVIEIRLSNPDEVAYIQLGTDMRYAQSERIGLCSDLQHNRPVCCRVEDGHAILNDAWVPAERIKSFIIRPGNALGLRVDLSGSLSVNPIQRVAEKALSGDFGTLTDWQRQGYEKLLRVTPKKKLAWITNYSHLDPGCNRTTASGRKVSKRVAAMLDVPFGSYVLIDLPGGYELRQVMDRGSRANLRRAQRRGAVTWCDRYLPYRSNRSWVRPIYIF